MSLTDEIQTVEQVVDSYRSLLKANKPREIKIPISMVEDADPSKMVMKQGDWVEFDHWPGMRCMLTREEEETQSKYILCHVLDEMDLGAHKHDGYIEEIYMMEGQMNDVIHQQRITTGQRIKYPAGESHWPVFPCESFFMVVFRKAAEFQKGELDLSDVDEKTFQLLKAEHERGLKGVAEFRSPMIRKS